MHFIRSFQQLHSIPVPKLTLPSTQMLVVLYALHIVHEEQVTDTKSVRSVIYIRQFW